MEELCHAVPAIGVQGQVEGHVGERAVAPLPGSERQQ
jgi:hypothetical protein